MGTENTSLDFSKMTDAALEASLNGDAYDPDEIDDEEGDEAPDDSAQPAADQQSAAEGEEGQQEQDQEGREQGEGDGQPKMVDLRALQEARAEAKRIREEKAAAEAELARYRQAEAERVARQHDAEVQATYEQLLAEEGEDAATNYIRAVTEQRNAQLQQQYAQREAVNTLSLSEEMIREVDQDYDTRFERMANALGQQATLAIINRALQENPRFPAKWLNDYAKVNFPTEAEKQAQFDAEVQRRMAELQGKNKKPAVRGHETIGHISSGTTNPGEKKPVRKMSDAELERELYD